MPTYSVAEAKANLSNLIDQAIAGEDVTITRHGKPMVSLHPKAQPAAPTMRTALNDLAARRATLRPGAPNSVELLNMMYEPE